jgi:hypothetical protein
MDQPLNPITKSVFNDLLETQTRLRDEAEGRWLAARRFILEITGYVASEWLYEKQTSGADLDRIPLETLIGVIREHITHLVMQTSATPVRVSDPDLRQKYQRLEENFRQAELRITELTGENKNLSALIRQMSENAQKSNTKQLPELETAFTVSDMTVIPDFYLEWTREKFFEREAYTLRLMGETGLARAPELKEAIIAHFEMGARSGSADETLASLLKRGFVTDYGTDGGLVGRPIGVIELTPLGQAVYLFLTGKKPVESEYAIKKDHKTDAHTRLNLKAQDWLKKAGYEILEHAPVIQTVGFVFNPDMVARRNNITLYIEVERESSKGNQDRDAKWRNFFQFTDGQMYIFCENIKAQRTIIREVNSALGKDLERAHVFICNLSQMSEERLSETGDVWTSVRQDE